MTPYETRSMRALAALRMVEIECVHPAWHVGIRNSGKRLIEWGKLIGGQGDII